ncbi:hypothetical protein [Streptomyces hawaiiensis]|uniref:Uncharacterized protein n=1 Tax=Streptomyces hawaiiensis TaxID=67305 RepID=A0A6G5RL82_9ACTN|nr:hypothetical protein [Streptomyces hawaiiensis]QCD58790.1 hypothetical protein CEB94_31125 [Streptomyces hawaiiensis]
MDQPPVLHHAGAAAPEPAVATAGTDVWESDLADLAALPLSAVDGLPTLPPTTRLLTEVLRARSSMRSGEGGGSGARAD